MQVKLDSMKKEADLLYSYEKAVWNATDLLMTNSRMIPAQSKGPNGEKVVSGIHSHLKTTPYITATDICTFR